MATLDDKVLRILRTAIRFGWLDRDQTDPTWPLYSDQGRKVALQSAQDSMVLLKNGGGLLPLDRTKIKSIAIVGPDAYPAVPDGGGSAQVKPFNAVSYLQGLNDVAGESVSVLYNRALTPISDIYNNTQFTTDSVGGKRGLTAEYFNSSGFKRRTRPQAGQRTPELHLVLEQPLARRRER
jgi:beta-glucosidase